MLEELRAIRPVVAVHGNVDSPSCAPPCPRASSSRPAARPWRWSTTPARAACRGWSGCAPLPRGGRRHLRPSHLPLHKAREGFRSSAAAPRAAARPGPHDGPGARERGGRAGRSGAWADDEDSGTHPGMMGAVGPSGATIRRGAGRALGWRLRRDEDSEALEEIPGGADQEEARVIEDWADTLPRGDISAAELFAPPQPGPERHHRPRARNPPAGRRVQRGPAVRRRASSAPKPPATTRSPPSS